MTFRSTVWQFRFPLRNFAWVANSVPPKQRACARKQISATAHTHKFAVHKHMIVDNKMTIVRQKINFSGTYIAPIQAKDLGFWSSPDFVHTSRFNSG